MTDTKPKRRKRENEQSKRFIEKARELGADESSAEEFERTFQKVVPPVKPPKKAHSIK